MPSHHPLAGEPDYEELWTCPYNAAHRVAHKRKQFHLTKCRKGHPNAKKEVCPYNTTHMVNEQEFQFHLETCPSRGIIDNFRYTIPHENHMIDLPPAPVVPPAEENWDNEYSETYEPTKKVTGAPIIHTFIGGTKSERKKRRAEQRQKFRAYDESTPNIMVREEPKLVVENDDKPLRQPRTSLLENLRKNADMLNRLKTSVAANATESTSKQQGVAKTLERNAAASGVWTTSTPGPSRECDDGTIIFKPKGRGGLKQ